MYKSNIPNQTQKEIQDDIHRMCEEFNANRDPDPILTPEEIAEMRAKVVLNDGIKLADNYETCCEKMQRKADYIDTIYKYGRAWLTSTPNIELLNTLSFIDESLSEIEGSSSIVLSYLSDIERAEYFRKYLSPIEA
ncbi:MAG: hypothetical protein COB67_10305 [SAR324 cluster bacterium]|uniref:Uncharacterized protein n=1 Tax=SAR324 cluster bacterium TaxID=2024889 RepID=A0A2A4SXT8_9DELT|nr:MAG: hypothetical protein COB67_10305 [SAR324 cluster bacterium]